MGMLNCTKYFRFSQSLFRLNFVLKVRWTYNWDYYVVWKAFEREKSWKLAWDLFHRCVATAMLKSSFIVGARRNIAGEWSPKLLFTHAPQKACMRENSAFRENFPFNSFSVFGRFVAVGNAQRHLPFKSVINFSFLQWEKESEKFSFREVEKVNLQEEFIYFVEDYSEHQELSEAYRETLNLTSHNKFAKKKLDRFREIFLRNQRENLSGSKKTNLQPRKYLSKGKFASLFALRVKIDITLKSRRKEFPWSSRKWKP